MAKRSFSYDHIENLDNLDISDDETKSLIIQLIREENNESRPLTRLPSVKNDNVAHTNGKTQMKSKSNTFQSQNVGKVNKLDQFFKTSKKSKSAIDVAVLSDDDSENMPNNVKKYSVYNQFNDSKNISSYKNIKSNCELNINSSFCDTNDILLNCLKKSNNNTNDILSQEYDFLTNEEKLTLEFLRNERIENEKLLEMKRYFCQICQDDVLN